RLRTQPMLSASFLAGITTLTRCLRGVSGLLADSISASGAAMSWPFKLNPPGLPEGSEKRDRAGTAPVRCALGNPADPNEPARFDRLRSPVFPLPVVAPNPRAR